MGLGVGTVITLYYRDRADIGFKDGVEIEAYRIFRLSIRGSVDCCFILSKRCGLEQDSTQKKYPANELARRHPKPRLPGAVSGNFLFNTRRFSGAAAKVIQLGSSNIPTPPHLH